MSSSKLGAASSYLRLRSSHMVAEVGLFSTLHQHQWMHKAQGKGEVSIDAVRCGARFELGVLARR